MKTGVYNKDVMRKVLFQLLMLLIPTTVVAGGLAERINGIINQPSQRKVQFAVNIIRAETGESVYSFNPTRAITPASNMKIITTLTAIKNLGTDYEFKTVIGMSNKDLVIIGSGDPLLGDKENDAKKGKAACWIIDDIVEKLKQNRITEVGSIIVDTTVFDNQRVHPNWLEKDLNKWYACEISGLNFHDNSIEMSVAKVNGKVVINYEPMTGFVKISNEVKLISSGDSAVGANRSPSVPNLLTVYGKLKNQEGPFDVAIEGPASFFMYMLAEKMLSSGIAIKGQLIEMGVETGRNFKQIAEYKTPLTDCLARCNKDSLGLAAESLMKKVAAQSLGGRGGSWQVGQKVLSDYLVNLGISNNEFQIDDGSGLSRENKLSPNAITKALFDVYKSKNWQSYKESLAMAGTDGTIKEYFEEEPYKGSIFGKTGFMTGVRSFSGFCSTPNGDFLFSILTEGGNAQVRDAINNIVKALF